MMCRGFVLVAVLMCGPLFAEDDDPHVAVIVDSDSDRQPSHTVVPKYPRKARRDRIEGKVKVCFDVDRKGRTHRIAVRTSTHRTFERPSIKAVKASSFRALDDDLELQSMKACRTFIYSLKPSVE